MSAPQQHRRPTGNAIADAPFDVVGLLGASPLFGTLDRRSLEALAGYTGHRCHRRGEIIQRQGDAPGHLHVIVRGRVKLTLEAESGAELLLTILGPLDTFGEIAAIDGGEVAHTAVAIEAGATIFIRQTAILATFMSHGAFAAAFAQKLTQQLRAGAELLESSTLYGLDVRMARRLDDLGHQYGHSTDKGIQVDLPLTQSELAAMLGATRVRVNLLLGQYQDEGLIQLDRGSFTLLAPDEVRRRARR
jgi:CRP-like cAMP-binding protein